MKDTSRRPASAYRIKPPRPRRSSVEPDRWRWLGASFGLIFMIALLLGLGWIALSGTGRSRWVLQTTTPTPSTGSAGGSSAASPTPTLSAADAARTGTISGNLSFPGGTLPDLTICAERIGDASISYCAVRSAPDGAAYSFDVPVGSYYVYAKLQIAQDGYSTTYRAYYNQYVLCKTGSCAASLHTKYLPVTVTAGTEISEVNPTDWYTPSAQ